MSAQDGLTSATAVPHKTRQPGTLRLHKKRKRAPALPVRAFKSPRLLPYDQFLDENLAIDFQSVEVDARGNVLSSLRVLPIPVREVLVARQLYSIQRLAAGSVPTTLQKWHRNQLRQQIVNPQTNAVQTSGIRVS